MTTSSGYYSREFSLSIIIIGRNCARMERVRAFFSFFFQIRRDGVGEYAGCTVRIRLQSTASRCT